MSTDPLKDLVNNLTTVLVQPAVLLLFAVALVVFVWGLIQFLWALNTGGKDNKDGKQHMLWGVVGMFIMVAGYAIIKFIDNTIGSNLVH